MNLAFNNLKAKILVVEDTPNDIDWLVTVLQKNNYEVLLARNGCLALEIARTKLPDLILLDIILPDVSGYNICQHLKAFPQTSEIPIIFTSGLTDGLDVAKAFHVGGADFIIKPFQVEEILARIHNQLSQRYLQKILQQQSKLLYQQNKQLQTEITDRQFYQERLFTSEQKMRTVLAAMTDIVIVIDLTEEQMGNVEIIPTKASETFSSDIVSQIVEQFFLAETAETWLSLIQKAIKIKILLISIFVSLIQRRQFG